MVSLDKKKLEKRLKVLNSLMVIVILFACLNFLLLLYFASEHKMGAVANFLNLTDFELFWYSPFIFGGFAFFISALIIIISSLKWNVKRKIKSI